MIIDRAHQLEILEILAEAYPRYVDVNNIPGNREEINANLHYLLGHDLIYGQVTEFMDGGRGIGAAIITVAGLDFLADDGGLSAILGVVSVKLHEDTIRQLLIDRISASEIPQEERSSLVQAIRNLPAKAIGTLTEKLLERGADRMLDGTPTLGKLLSQLVAQQFG